MTTTQLLQLLNRQLTDLRYREGRAILWTTQGEQNRLYALGALSVIQAQIDDITYLVEHIEREGITDKIPMLNMATALSSQQNLATKRLLAMRHSHASDDTTAL